MHLNGFWSAAQDMFSFSEYAVQLLGKNRDHVQFT